MLHFLIDRRFIIAHADLKEIEIVDQIIRQNFLFSIISILMSVHIIFLKYHNHHYEDNSKILIHDLIFLRNKTLDLEKQLKKNFLSVHIKHFYIEKLLKDSYECPICLDIINENCNVFLTLCGHLFHHDCLNEAMVFNKKCPTCRRGIYIFNEEEESSEEEEEIEHGNLVMRDD
jgi:hypothetical protein